MPNTLRNIYKKIQSYCHEVQCFCSYRFIKKASNRHAYMNYIYRKSSAHKSRGQAIVEMAIFAPIFLGVLFGSINLSLYADQVMILNTAAREGARYASLNPTSFASSHTPSINTIEGVILDEANGLNMTNNNTDISLSYYIYNNTNGVQTLTECGYYDQSTGSFIAESGYTESNCATWNSWIKVSLTAGFTSIAPAMNSFLPNITISSSYWMVVF